MPLRLANLFAILFLWANYIISQTAIDIAKTKNSDNKTLIISKLSEEYLNKNNTTEADFKKFLNKNNITDSTEVSLALGYLSYSKQNYIKSVKHFLHANETLKKDENISLKIEILFQLANSYRKIRYQIKAIEYYQSMLKGYFPYLEIKTRHKIITNIGNAYYDLHKYDSAHYYYSTAKESADLHKDSVYQIISLINLGNLKMVLKDYSAAESTAKKALALSKIYKLEHLEVMCKFNLGELHYITKDYGTTKNLFSQVLKRAETSNFEKLIPDVYKYFVLIEFKDKKLKKALDFSSDFYKNLDKFESREKKIIAIKEVNRVLEELVYLNQANENLAKNTKLLDSILFKEVEEKDQLMESLQQLSELQGSYRDLVAENDLKEEKLLRFRIAIGLIFTILLLSSLFFGILFRSRNQIKKQNKTIQKQLKDIRKKNHETEELNHEINMQSEEIRVQNDQLLNNQRELEKRIQERTRDLEVALEKAEESDQLKTSFLQNLSHEIRTPLNAISGFAQLIARDKNTNPEFSEIIGQNVYDLIDIIDNIVLFSTLQANQYYSSISTTPVFSILNQLQGDFKLIKNKYKRKTIDLIIDNQIEENISLKTDVSLFQKMLIQLVENAFKFTEEGSVTLKVKEFADKIRISVIDTGIGIKEEKIPFIFDTFRKIESERLFRGTGIGLALVKKIIELLNGKISLTSEFGKGTSIHLDFDFQTI
jgi:signal transduction histidine kinase